VQAEGCDFLVVVFVGGDVAVVAVADESVGGVPVFYDVEAFVDLAAQFDLGEVVAEEDGALCFAEFVECPVGGVLHVGAGKPSEDGFGVGGAEVDDDKKLSFIVDLMVPWYVNFFVGWTEYERAGGVVQWVRYENMIAAPVDTMQSTVEGAGLKADPGAIQGAIATPKFDRLNIGVTGRGTRAFENRPTDLAKI